MATVSGATNTQAATLAASAQRGDVLALEQMIELHQRDMARVCVVVCGRDPDLGEEAAQAAWPIIWRKIDTLRDADRLRPWLISVAVNEARAIIRRRQRGHRRDRCGTLDIATPCRGGRRSARHEPAESANRTVTDPPSARAVAVAVADHRYGHRSGWINPALISGTLMPAVRSSPNTSSAGLNHQLSLRRGATLWMGQPMC
jgi:DNA-directed RNA polymerase specialized sigma24 family protein